MQAEARNRDIFSDCLNQEKQIEYLESEELRQKKKKQVQDTCPSINLTSAGLCC
jgi:hypothetical protein